ncbi:MAG: hypothetical protein A3I61_04420 [Acidobacteria bacterium RIFCSPLOWO2_02_FULL_68_18]|nr:MAG: hypothetical protein A3I61_04420 [Acidobacteria bacterium RIFCSPLOWO2_02_FULL_68_18]OFW48405.1 MAG: hypothetical protein A3G77_13025 [Acidobacteria bacterium RIFCSPLOWO2_12_FULL_68_19]
MTDDELRALVRAAIAQYAGAAPVQPEGGRPHGVPVRLHPSHGRFTRLPAGSDADGPCLIEPAITCYRCGYCQSYGH